MIDFEDKQVKALIANIATFLDKSIDEVIAMYKYLDEHKRFVRFVEGEHKGKVGIVYPETDYALNPLSKYVAYSKTVELPDGHSIWCPRYETELQEISEEEYLREIRNDTNNT